MKIFLASFFEPEYHGKGRKIGICPSKPKNLKDQYGYECDFQYEAFSPEEIYWTLHKERKAAGDDDDLKEKATNKFVREYVKKLKEVRDVCITSAEKEKKTIFDVIGLEDGDTLLTWEKCGNPTYRVYVADLLRDFGYEVEEY